VATGQSLKVNVKLFESKQTSDERKTLTISTSATRPMQFKVNENSYQSYDKQLHSSHLSNDAGLKQL
jgi:hypothetical protein